MGVSAWSAIRDWFSGVGRGSASSCSGDPIAAERDAAERYRQRQDASSAVKPSEPATQDSPSRTQSSVRNRALLAVLMVLSLSSLGFAQFRGFFARDREPQARNQPYDGRFTFARLKYTTAPEGYWYQGIPSWAHGYPMSEDNLMRIMNEISFLGGRTDAYDLFSVDDEELSKYPIAYITEPGWWRLNDAEAQALRAYIAKGGFLIVDDFKIEGDFAPGGGWEPFEENMKRVLPGARVVELTPSHPIFHAFFEIDSLSDFPQAYNAGRPVFLGIYEDNDPKKRLMVVINYNTDISQYWEWSGRGLRPFDETNEAYKLGVNYIIYGLTH